MDTKSPNSPSNDLPRVQIPLGSDRPGLSIDGEFTSVFQLPDEASEAYMKYARQGGNVRIYQCDKCGYLTDADAFSATSYHAHECSGCGARLKGSAQNRSDETYTQVHGPVVDADSDRHVNVLGVVSDGKCPRDHGPTVEGDPGSFGTVDVDEEAVECDACVPNHPSHLGRLKNEVGGEITQKEMMLEVAEAVKEFRS